MAVKIKKWYQTQRNLVIDLFKQGKTFRSINKATGMAIGTISDLIKKYNMFGYVQNQPRFGAKRKTTSRIDRQVVKMVQKNRFLSAPKVSSLLEKDFGLKVSPCTIRKRLKESGFKARVPRKKPFLSKIHQKRRLAFAKKYVNMPVSFWRKVLWTDESKFNLVKSDGAQKVWRKKGEAFTLSCIRGTVKFSGGNVMVWGSWLGTEQENWSLLMELWTLRFMLTFSIKIFWLQLKNCDSENILSSNKTMTLNIRQRKQKSFLSKSKLSYLNGLRKVQISIQLNISGLFWIKNVAHDV